MPLRTSPYKERLRALRAAFKAQGVNGFLVPRADEYQGEYVPESAARLEWLTGFTGSAGIAVVLEAKACVMTDGRYTIQVTQEVDPALFQAVDSVKVSVADWLTGNAVGGDIIGYDPRLHTPAQIVTIEKGLEGRHVELRALEDNPLDTVWTDRPPAPAGTVEIFPQAVAGVDSSAKRAQIAARVQEAGLLAAIITLPDSIAWLLNIRGSDLPCVPVALSYAVIDARGYVRWFIDRRKTTAQIIGHIGPEVEIVAPGDLQGAVEAMARDSKAAGRPVGLDFKRSPAWFTRQLRLHGATVRDFRDPCIAPKAIKNAAEQAGIRAAHQRDGAALCAFLAWLEGAAAAGQLDEIAVAEKLEKFRRAADSYRGPSFPTIAGFNANGAIVHYRATPRSNAKIVPPGLLLLDSGAQYADGTTDITRTIAIGRPAEEMRRHFTLVLKGHIAVAAARFPEGTTGQQVDALARAPLQAQGLDYAHGTGHGVGCYLSVHEEAASLSARGTEPVQAGMLISNEPGYYKEGAYGIRTESLVMARRGNDGMLEFETVSLAPIDRGLIAVEMLDAAERGWVDAYHARVNGQIGPLLEAGERRWLEAATAPL